MSLAQVFTELNVTQAQFGKDMRLSRSATSRLITHGLWPNAMSQSCARSCRGMAAQARRFASSAPCTCTRWLSLLSNVPSSASRRTPNCKKHITKPLRRSSCPFAKKHSGRKRASTLV